MVEVHSLLVRVSSQCCHFVESLQHQLSAPDHAHVFKAEAMLLAEGFHLGRAEVQVVAGHGGEQVVLYLPVQAPCEPVVK